MITQDTMFEPLLEAAPGFNVKWKEFVEEWEGERRGLPLYLVMPELARYIVHLIEGGEQKELKAIFNVIERWHLEGDAYVSEAATIGILEDLQNLNIVKEQDMPDRIEELLEPESKKMWFKLYEFWNGVSKSKKE